MLSNDVEAKKINESSKPSWSLWSRIASCFCPLRARRCGRKVKKVAPDALAAVTSAAGGAEANLVTAFSFKELGLAPLFAHNKSYHDGSIDAFWVFFGLAAVAQTVHTFRHFNRDKSFFDKQNMALLSSELAALGKLAVALVDISPLKGIDLEDKELVKDTVHGVAGGFLGILLLESIRSLSEIYRLNQTGEWQKLGYGAKVPLVLGAFFLPVGLTAGVVLGPVGGYNDVVAKTIFAIGALAIAALSGYGVYTSSRNMVQTWRQPESGYGRLGTPLLETISPSDQEGSAASGDKSLAEGSQPDLEQGRVSAQDPFASI